MIIGPRGGERRAEDDRQPGADASEAERVDHRRDPDREEVGADEQAGVGGVQADRGRQDQRHGDRAGHHHEDVLEADQKRTAQR